MTGTTTVEKIIAFAAAFPYPFLIPLLGAFFGGEETIIVISALSTTGFVSFPVVVVFSYVGTILSDTTWFLVGQRFMNWLSSKKRIQEGLVRVDTLFGHTAQHKPFLLLLITKFLYGIRIATIFYMSRRMSFPSFMAYNAAVTLIWVIPICLVGWLLGISAVKISTISGDIKYGLGLVTLIIIAFYGIRIWLNRKVTKA